MPAPRQYSLLHLLQACLPSGALPPVEIGVVHAATANSPSRRIDLMAESIFATGMPVERGVEDCELAGAVRALIVRADW